jgi:hypothetical protein
MQRESRWRWVFSYGACTSTTLVNANANENDNYKVSLFDANEMDSALPYQSLCENQVCSPGMRPSPLCEKKVPT